MRVFNAPLTWSTDQATYTATGDISNATLYSTPMFLRHIDTYAVQLVTSGATVTGTFKLQASNDDPNIPQAGYPAASSMNWTDIDGSSQTVTVAGTPMWNALGAGYQWVRVVWTKSGAAAGSVSGRIHGKAAQ